MIPAFMLKKLYRKGSLKNEAAGAGSVWGCHKKVARVIGKPFARGETHSCNWYLEVLK